MNSMFDEDYHPSFGVNREGNYWQCFSGCGSGSIIDFWMKWKGVEFYQAVKELAELLGVEKKMNGQLPRLLTIREVASYLRMSKSQVYAMVTKKKLPCIRLSERRIVVSEEDLAAFIQRQKAMTPNQLVFMLDRILDN